MRKSLRTSMKIIPSQLLNSNSSIFFHNNKYRGRQIYECITSQFRACTHWAVFLNFVIKCYPNLFNNLELKSLKLTICIQNDKHTNRWGWMEPLVVSYCEMVNQHTLSFVLVMLMMPRVLLRISFTTFLNPFG